jgi:ATP-binding cassette subfamily B protein
LENTEVERLLQGTALFGTLPEDEVDRLAERFTLVRYRLGQVVCRAGEKSDAFFLVYEGRARVVAPAPDGGEVTVGMLTRGSHFGEHGLLRDAPRQYTVRAASELALLRLPEADFDRLLERRPELEAHFARHDSEIAILNFLKLYTVLAPLSPGEIRGLLGRMEVREFGAGEPIVREGDVGDAFYILRTGSARVVKDSENGRVLGHLKPGDGFGELALLTGQARAASVVAKEPSSVFRLEKAQFDDLIARAPKLRDAFVTLASGYSRSVLRDEAAPARPAAEPAPAPDEAGEPFRPRRARRYPALLQASETDCGAACLAMVLRFWGKNVAITRLRELAQVGREGTTLQALADAGEAVGLRARGVRAVYAHLEKAELPAVAHWEGFHYVVVYEARPDRVVLADPAVGLRRMRRDEFLAGWTGYLLLLTPTPMLRELTESRTTLGRYLPLIRPHRRLLAEILLASLLLQLFGLAMPVFTQLIVDKVLVHENRPLLDVLLLGMLVVALFQAATVSLRQYLLVHTTRRIDLEMLVAFYRHLLALPLRFFEERRVGDILKRFNENAKIRHLLTGRAVGVLLDLLTIVAYLGLMLAYSPDLTLVAALFLPLYAALVLVMTPVLQRQYREAFQRSAEAESHMVETVTGIGTVKAAAAERPVRWRFEGLMVRTLNVQFRGALTGTAGHAAASVLQTLNAVLLLWYGAGLVIAGRMSVGQLVAFNVLVLGVNRAILNVLDLWDEVQEVRVSLERLSDVFDAAPEETPDGARAQDRLPPLQGYIRFDNVTFRYAARGDRNALQNVNLEIAPGQTVALVGRSGAGKSTFANLLLRLYEPTEGRIYVDRFEIRQVSLASLRSQIGVVPQEVFLFSGTIRDNIAFGEPGATLEEVVGAAMLAGAHEFISELPLGYDTVIGERGQSLSGGQRQRIAIARALYKKPRILIFDEATSALDTESERAIQQNLDHILKNRTTLIIAHRLSTVRNADRIVVLDQGVVVETGTHDALMRQRGLYHYLISQQMEA